MSTIPLPGDQDHAKNRRRIALRPRTLIGADIAQRDGVEAIGAQIFWLLVLAIPIASISWTVTHEEIFREFHEYMVRESQSDRPLLQRKLFYLFTCEFCLSHWVTLLVVAVTRFRLLVDAWWGFVIAFFALVWVANHYMSFYARLRLDVKRERVEIALTEAEKEKRDA